MTDLASWTRRGLVLRRREELHCPVVQTPPKGGGQGIPRSVFSARKSEEVLQGRQNKHEKTLNHTLVNQSGIKSWLWLGKTKQLEPMVNQGNCGHAWPWPVQLTLHFYGQVCAHCLQGSDCRPCTELLKICREEHVYLHVYLLRKRLRY